MNTFTNRLLAFLHRPLIGVSVSVVLLTVLSFVVASRQGRLEEFELQLSRWNLWYIPVGVGLGLLTFGLAVALTQVSSRLIGNDDRPTSRHYGMIGEMMKNRWLFPLIALPGGCEELLFRGNIQPMCIEGLELRDIPYPALGGILLTALFFGFYHRDKAGKFFTLQHLLWGMSMSLSSACWGCAVYVTGSLWLAILAHGSHNFLIGWRVHNAILQDEQEAMEGGGNGADSSPPVS